jgi:hypothetical protein
LEVWVVARSKLVRRAALLFDGAGAAEFLR